MSRRKRNPHPDRRDQSGATSKSKERYDNISGPQGTKPGDPGIPEADKSKDAETPSKSNDPDWYNADPQLLLDSASFPYAQPLGDDLNLYPISSSAGGGTWIDTNNAQFQKGIAGVCALVVKPSYGFSRDMKDPLNVCANAFYTHVRYVNSGRKNYDATDLMLYALSWADVYSAIFWAQRLYQIAFTYSQRNKYIGDSLLLLNGVDPKSLRDNLANYRYRLNAFINKVSSFVVPANINIFKRRAFMYTGLYLENRDNNIKDQLYMFVPHGFYKFALDADNKGMLQYTPMTRNTVTGMSWDSVLSILEGLLDNITGDEDFGLMSGDILKAYGENIIGVSPMAEEAYILPIHDPFVLSQFKNAVISPNLLIGNSAIHYYVGSDTTHLYTSGDLCQDTKGHLLSIEVTNETDSISQHVVRMYQDGNHIISVENPLPGPADSIEASRFIVARKGAAGNVYANEAVGGYAVGDAIRTIYCGSEVVISTCIAQFGGAEGLNIYTSSPIKSNLILIPDDGPSVPLVYGSNLEDILFVMKTNMFKYYPIMIGLYGHKASSTSDFAAAQCTPISNIDNYTIVSRNEVAKMHECALLSLFFVPGVAKMVNYM